MKPKLFVGSSVEGLNIAYAVHQNLQYQAEVTVWDQGVFNLSRSALDSLLKVLENSDFGVFIFSPDDMVKMHGKESRTVRDNVLFELGLFIGKLGQDRSFILTPRDHTDLHLPTDLIGITPGTYETDRIDGSFQAATGPACNEIRKAINLLGFISKVSNLPSAPQSDDRSTQLEEKALEISSKNNEHSEDKDSITEKKSSKDEFGWLDSYLEQDYEKAISLLEEKLEGTDELRLRSYYKSWIGRSLAKKDFETGIQYLNDLKEEFPESVHPYNGIAQVYIDNQLFEEAISVYDLGLTIVQDKYWLTVEKSQGLDEMGYSTEALNILDNLISEYPQKPLAYAEKADLLKKLGDKDEAINAFERGLKYFPTSERLLYSYGDLLIEMEENEAALAIFTKLKKIAPNNHRFRTLLGNVLYNFKLYGLALECYQEANELAEQKEDWIIANIGNIYGARGFHAQAIKYLKKAADLSIELPFTFERLADEIKNDEEERRKASEIVKNYLKSKQLISGLSSEHSESTKKIRRPKSKKK